MSRALQLVALLLALSGCAEPLQPAKIASGGDPEFFSVLVQPVLLRDCGFQACHGSQERFFRVYGPGRVRHDPSTAALAPLTGTEFEYTYQLARGMIDLEDPARSLILRKPLAVEAGGSGHEGVDKYGRNVYRTPDDQGYLQIAQWVFSQPEFTAPVAPAAGAPAIGTPAAGAPAVGAPPAP